MSSSWGTSWGIAWGSSWGSSGPPPAGMPSLIGVNYYEGLLMLQQLGIYVPVQSYGFLPSTVTVKWQKSNAYGGGIIIGQSIAPGASYTANEPITLTVSSFPFSSVIDSPPDWSQT